MLGTELELLPTLIADTAEPLPDIDDRTFGVNIIPITQTATNLGAAQPGIRVNLEIDLIARYVARLLGKEAS